MKGEGIEGRRDWEREIKGRRGEFEGVKGRDEGRRVGKENWVERWREEEAEEKWRKEEINRKYEGR